jgi:hypothetical protein
MDANGPSLEAQVAIAIGGYCLVMVVVATIEFWYATAATDRPHTARRPPVSHERGESKTMKYSIGARVRLSQDARRRLIEGEKEAEHVRVAHENRAGVVIQWISEGTQPTGYLVDFRGVYMAVPEEDLEAAE